MKNTSFEYENGSNEPRNVTKVWDKWTISLMNRKANLLIS